MYIEEKIQRSWLWGVLYKVQRFLMFVSTVSVVLMLGIVVVARYILHVNVLGYDEIILVGAYWMYFIGGSYAMWEESHIKADILSVFLSPRGNLKISILAKGIQVLLGIPLIYLAYEMLAFDWQANPTTVDWNIPLLIPQSAILIGYVLMTFYSVIYLMRDIHKLKDANYEGGGF